MIRDRVSEILGISITGNFKTQLDRLDQEGRVTKKVQLDLILVLLDAVERLEDGTPRKR